jgi:hypothetical protein
MTITEASNVNVLLSYILGGSSAGNIPTSRESFEQAAVYLADRASQALHAGWDSKRVERAFEEGVTA